MSRRTRFGRPIGNTDSLSFLYNREDEDVNQIETQDPRQRLLVVDSVNFYAKENARNHKTEKFELVQDQGIPVLRRGANIYLGVIPRSGNFDFNQDKLKIFFEFGKYPSLPKGTQVVLNFDYSKQRLDPLKSEWDVLYHRETGNTLILQIQIGCTAPVGAWKCRIETSNRQGSTAKHVCRHPVYILFNPYCSDDTVFMPSEGELDEYVQNDAGKVYKGDHKQPFGRSWIFGQFDDVVLPACSFILDHSGLKPSERGNPIKVARAISAMVNSADDDGVVYGRWIGSFDDGTAPWDWNGSVKILEQYMRDGGKPVRYGQCWVFSAVTVTICRALGLPCRSVTNFVSAHDTNGSLTVDKFFDEEGNELGKHERPDGGTDSIWNYHVWNDVWMARPDLPSGYGGWQAIDATPQEESDNMYQCGPAPVEAVRRGEIGLGFDVPFVFAEVNADAMHFVRDRESDWGFRRSRMDKTHVGRKIVTKSVGFMDEEGDSDAHDITWQYKNTEGGYSERLAVYNAIRGIPDKAARIYYSKPIKEDVFMDLVDLETVRFGDIFKARILLENQSNEERTLKAMVSCSSVYYTGITAKPIKRCDGIFYLRPREKETLALTVYPDEYMGLLVDQSMVKVYGLIQVEETKQTWSEEDDLVLLKPKLNVQVPKSLVHGRPGQVRISLVNPLDVPLTNCRFSVECGRIVSETVERLGTEVGPRQRIAHNMLVVPRRAGTGTIAATFGSDQMNDINGTTTIEVL